MRSMKLLVATMLFLVMTTGVGHAAYRSERDQRVSVTVAPSLLSFDGSTAATTFELQERVHTALSNGSGAEVDHYYFWIVVNGQPILAVDPVWVEAE